MDKQSASRLNTTGQTKAGESDSAVWDSDHTLLLGEYTHKIDAKGRLALPAKFRGQLTAGAVVAKSPAKSLYLFSAKHWQEMSKKLSALPKYSQKALKTKRTILGSATVVTPDRQGRILIPGNLRAYAGFTSDVVVAGLGDQVEICAADRWQSEKIDLESIESDLEELGI